jgi:hypothetical protein
LEIFSSFGDTDAVMNWLSKIASKKCVALSIVSFRFSLGKQSLQNVNEVYLTRKVPAGLTPWHFEKEKRKLCLRFHFLSGKGNLV